jgi:oxygen-independent coproporphyrinogen-3 oxidase
MFYFKPLSELGLYIHVPFCKRKCFYCDFYSEPSISVDESTIQKVMKETLIQGKYWLAQLGEPAIKTVYIGGGTPSSLPLDQLEALLAFVHSLKKATPDFEFTVEANPESLSSSFIALCQTYGVNRLSVGIQTFRKEQLELLGRSASPEMNYQALERLDALWKGRFNLDLITGLPGQDPKAVREDLASLIKVRPEHVSLYSLTIEEETGLEQKINRGEITLASEDYRDELWLDAAGQLRQAGFIDYEISNFALPGRECWHNMAYWELNPYLGLGPGGVSTLPVVEAGEEKTQVVRLQNPCSLPVFIQGRGSQWGSESERIGLTDFFIENLMMGFRLKQGIAKARFLKRFGVELPVLLGGLWERWLTGGMAEAEAGDFYRLTDRGRLLLNRLMEEVIGQRDEAEQRLSAKQLNWP